MIRNVRYKNNKQNFDEEVTPNDAGSEKTKLSLTEGY